MAQAKVKWIGGGVLTALLLTGGLGMMVLTAGPGPDEPKPVAKQAPKPPVKETPEAAELKKLQGVWKVTKIVNERGVAPDEEIKPMRLEFVGSTFDGPHEFQKKTPFTLDLTTSPKQMTSQPTPDITEASIYELKGDTLRICSLSGGQQVPTEFKVAKGVNGMLIELERVPVPPLPKSMDNVPELKDLAGEWSVISDREPGIVEIYRDMMWTTREGKTEKAIITLDAKKHYFDITPITGPKDRIGKPVLGLFTWEENQIEIFSGPLGDERTTEAKTSKSVIVIILKRVKKK